MSESQANHTTRWFNRILNSRRKYFFEHFRDLNSWSDFSLFKMIGWLREDVVYLTTWKINILLQLRTFGPGIRKEYCCSFFKQFYRMMVVAFIKRVQPKYFRSYLLFLDERWSKVDSFTFDQYEVQYKLVDACCAEEKEILQSKLRFYKYCKKLSFNSPEVLGAFDDGKIIYQGNDKLQMPEADIFVKDIYGKSGQGTKRFYFHGDGYSDSEANFYSKEDIRNFLLNYSKEVRPTVVQKIEKNHSSWLPFTSGSLCTCRLVTVKMSSGNSIKPLFCMLRMPIGKSDADNFALGGIASAIDLETGVFKRAMAVKPINGRFQFDSHPDTGQPITGTPLPHLDQIINYAIKIHSTFKIPFLGWDVAMTENGPCVIEGNIGWGADIVEATLNKPLIETEYPELFEDWFRSFQKKS